MTVIKSTGGLFGSRVVPLLVGSSRDELFRAAKRDESGLSAIHTGLSLHVRDNPNDFLVTRSSLLRDDFTLRNVRAIRERERGRFEALTRIGYNTVDAWENSPVWREHRRSQWRSLFRREIRGSHSGADLWALMIIDWVLHDDSAPARRYFAGEQSLLGAFRDHLKIRNPEHDAQLNRWWSSKFEREVTRLGRGNLVLDHKFAVHLEESHAARLKSMREIGPIYEAYARIWMFIFSLFTGASSVVALRAASEAFMGYMDFMIELYNAERDGVITEQEAKGVETAFWFTFLPMGAFFGKASEVAVGVFSLGYLAFTLATVILQALIDLLGKLERRLAAERTRFGNYVEVDPDMEIFIPATHPAFAVAQT